MELCLVLHDIRSTYNVGSILRSAEVFGVKQIFYSGYTPYPQMKNDTRLPHLANKINRAITKTSLGAENHLKSFVFSDMSQVLKHLREHNYTIAALEQSSQSKSLDNYFPTTNIALILGNEVNGVNDWTLKNCDVILEIEQFGQKESLNVASAAAIAIYELNKKLLQNGTA